MTASTAKRNPLYGFLMIGMVVIVLLLLALGLRALFEDQPADTDTPSSKAQQIINEVTGRDADVEVSANLVSVKFPLNQVNDEIAVSTGEANMVEILCELKAAGLTETRRVTLIGTIQAINDAGETLTYNGISAELDVAAIEALDCAAADQVDLETAANNFSLHPALNVE